MTAAPPMIPGPAQEPAVEAVAVPASTAHGPAGIPFPGEAPWPYASGPNAKYRHLLDRSALRADLKNRSINAGLMVLGGQVGQVILKLASITVLARLLTPDDYGLVGMAWVFAAFVSMFSDMGLSMATVQREHITHEQVSTLFWLNMGICALVAAVIAALAPAAAWFYREPRVLPLMLAFAALPLVSGLALQPAALLKRQMRQKALVSIHLCATVIGVVVAITMGAMGFGYWSLVGMEATQATLATAATLAVVGWLPSAPRRGVGARAMLRFGGALTVSNAITYWGGKGDALLIGRFLGAYPLGLYSRAYSLMCLPLMQIVWPLKVVTVPALSALKDSPEQFRACYLKLIRMIASVCFPMVAFAAVMSEGVIRTGLGLKWMETVPIFRILALAGLLQTIASPLGALCIALGLSRRMICWTLLTTPIVLLSFACGLPWGPAGVASCYAASMALVVVPLSHLFVLRGTPVRVHDLLKGLRFPALQGLLIALTLMVLQFIFPSFALRPTGMAIGILITIAIWLLLNRTLGADQHVFGDLAPVLKNIRCFVKGCVSRPTSPSTA